MPKKRRMSAAQRRIHEAALRIFAERGTTEVSVSDLAQAAGVARGTIYNNLESPENLFERVAAQLADEMNERVAASYTHVDDPAERTAIGVRLYIRRAHEEPHRGRFIVHFGFSNDSLRNVWTGPPMRDLVAALQQGLFDFPPEQVPSALGLIAGTTVSAILMVLEGIKTWRDAGTETTTMILRGLGVEPERAIIIAGRELPELVEL